MKPAPPLSLSIQFADDKLRNTACRQQIRRWVKAALDRPAELAIRFVDAEESRTLNRDFRHKDYATNVLTFNYDPLPDATEDVAQADIIICSDVVMAEAHEQHKPVKDHLAHLVIHGVLHAQGYDHENDGEAEAMEALERALLSRFRIADPYA